MRMFSFEVKKLFRITGTKGLCAVLLAAVFVSVLFWNFGEIPPEREAAHIEKYESNIRYVISLAELNLLEYKEGSYTYRYQLDVIDRYTALLESGTAPKPVRGWNEYFSFGLDDLVLLLLSAMAGICLTMTEYDSGTYIQLKITPRGRKCMRYKIGVLALAAVILTLLTGGASLAGIAARFGLSSPLAPVCSVIRFAYFPYDLPILACLALSVVFKIANAYAMMLFVSLIATVFKGYIVSFFVAGAVTLGGYGLSTLKFSGSSVYLNPYTLGTTDTLWERYRSLDIFGISVPFITAALVTILLVSIGLCLLLIFFGGKLEEIMAQNGFEKKIRKAVAAVWSKIVSALPHRKARRHSLLTAEAKKSFIKSRLFILLAVMIVCKTVYSEASVPRKYYAEWYYRDLCYEMSGELTIEKFVQIQTGLSESQSVISQAEYMRNAKHENLISQEEFDEYIDRYNHANLEEYAYQKLQMQCMRIFAAEERGLEASIIYDTGWDIYFAKDVDVILWAFLLLFFCGIYTEEYRSGFHMLADTTRGGMKALHRAKLLFAVIVAALVFILFAGIDFYYLMRAYELPNAGFTLASVMETSLNLPLWGAAALLSAANLLAALIVASAVCFLSRILKRTYLVVPVGAILFGMVLLICFTV